MKTRLSKISREYNAHLSDIADFLQKNGFDYSEDPNEELSQDALETIHFNLSAFLAEKHKQDFSQKTLEQNGLQPAPSASEPLPLEIKIIEAASKEKKFIERIIGFTEFDWYYSVAKFTGECSQPVEFNLFDEVICDLLLKEEMSAERVGEILGLDIKKDLAENEIIQSAISDLKKEQMVEGDDSILWLTDIGKEYARNGVKFQTFTRDFELYFDETGDEVVNAKAMFSALKSEKVIKPVSEYSFELDTIRHLAEKQAPEIHFPEKGYHLQAAHHKKSEAFKAKVWAILLENFRDNTLRVLIYDEKQNAVIDALSEALNPKEEIKSELLSRLVNNDDSIEITSESKPVEQVVYEQELIKKQEEFETALESHEIEKVKALAKEALAIKRHFNSLEFEIELKRLFDETANDLWIISPWIKNATLKRIPFFEKYLKKGGRIFVGYSEPEEQGQVMAYEEPLNKLRELEKHYHNFYLHQLPPFHYKNVWLRTETEQVYYTGSYNILSFFVKQGLQNVRQEKMTRLDWNQEIEEEFLDVVKRFGMKYLNSTIEEFNHLCKTPPVKIDKDFLQKLSKFDNSKLKPFLKLGIYAFEAKLQELEKTKSENINFYRKKYFLEKTEEYKKQVAELSAKPISYEKKKTLMAEFERFRDEHIDFFDLQKKASEVTVMIERLQIIKSTIHHHTHNNHKRRR